jgi:hypothetical protein
LFLNCPKYVQSQWLLEQVSQDDVFIFRFKGGLVFFFDGVFFNTTFLKRTSFDGAFPNSTFGKGGSLEDVAS